MSKVLLSLMGLRWHCFVGTDGHEMLSDGNLSDLSSVPRLDGKCRSKLYLDRMMVHTGPGFWGRWC